MFFMSDDKTAAAAVPMQWQHTVTLLSRERAGVTFLVIFNLVDVDNWCYWLVSSLWYISIHWKFSNFHFVPFRYD
jgi:hypothetical protein